MKVTILGSCRQDSLYRRYDVTSIKNLLSFPHYSREVLEVIAYLKGTADAAPDAESRWLFRTCILTGKALPAALFRPEFDATELFVVEIASRIAYVWNGRYVHHILTEPKYGFPRIADIAVRDLTDEEIEADLVRIRDLLQPRKLMIVSHISTRKAGKRHELVEHLRRSCANHRIPFFDPMTYLQGHDPSRIFEIPKDAFHYTPEGHEVIGEAYGRFIDSQFPRGEAAMMEVAMADVGSASGDRIRPSVIAPAAITAASEPRPTGPGAASEAQSFSDPATVRQQEKSLPHDFLRIYRSERPKLRVGSRNGDGGYVIAAGIDIYDAIVSCGVADDITFEVEMCRLHPRIPCIAYDGTVDRLPAVADTRRIEFVRKNITYYDSDTTTTLSDVIDTFANIFLKMDIETFEFRWLQAISPLRLAKIAQMVVEVHFPFNEPGLTHLDAPLPVEQKVDALRKLARTHTLVHLHANNVGGTSVYRGLRVPNVFECTYLRRDLQPATNPSIDPIPSALDRPNILTRPDIALSGYPWNA
jgi:hypothetical protein